MPHPASFLGPTQLSIAFVCVWGEPGNEANLNLELLKETTRMQTHQSDECLQTEMPELISPLILIEHSLMAQLGLVSLYNSLSYRRGAFYLSCDLGVKLCQKN